MIRYLLDTNAVGDLMNHRRGVDVRAKEARQRGAVIGTCELVVAELFFGVENSATKDENLPLLRHSLGGLKCWPLSRAAGREKVSGKGVADPFRIRVSLLRAEL